MNALVLKGHDKCPQRRRLVDGRMTVGEALVVLNESTNGAVSLLSVLSHFAHPRPCNRGLREVVPGHLIDTSLEENLVVRIDRLFENLRGRQLSDQEELQL